MNLTLFCPITGITYYVMWYKCTYRVVCIVLYIIHDVSFFYFIDSSFGRSDRTDFTGYCMSGSSVSINVRIKACSNIPTNDLGGQCEMTQKKPLLHHFTPPTQALCSLFVAT